MDLDMMIFALDLNTSGKGKEMNIPSAPPPSPSFRSARRKQIVIPDLKLDKLINCCEDLIASKSQNNEVFFDSSPLTMRMKRKNSDSDECPSYGSSPGSCGAEFSSYSKRSRSSLNLEGIQLFKSSMN